MLPNHNVYLFLSSKYFLRHKYIEQISKNTTLKKKSSSTNQHNWLSFLAELIGICRHTYICRYRIVITIQSVVEVSWTNE